LSLFVGDFVQGVGIAFDIRWISKGIVACGGYCTAQGVLRQTSETIVYVDACAIAVHTFISIFFRRGEKAMILSLFIVCIIWLYVILFVCMAVSSHTKGNDIFNTPTPYWCWIGSQYTAERIAGEYFWIWFTGLISLVLYVLLYFCIRGNIVVEENKWWRIHFRRVGANQRQKAASAPAKDAFIVLLYPAAYFGLRLGLSIVRWINFVGRSDPNDISPNVASGPTFFVQTISALSGVVNVVLLAYTRPGLLLLGEHS
ncbi:hypothetical protein BU17DRAFT_10379, partial [Hysterangium stoloniferum]